MQTLSPSTKLLCSSTRPTSLSPSILTACMSASTSCSSSRRILTFSFILSSSSSLSLISFSLSPSLPSLPPPFSAFCKCISSSADRFGSLAGDAGWTRTFRSVMLLLPSSSHNGFTFSTFDVYVPDVPDVYVPEVVQNFGLGGTAGLIRLCLKESCQGIFMQKRQMGGICKEKDV